jgi:hypothetical protein
MIELLLKAIDRLIDLVRVREKRTRFRYDEIYKPAFAELQSVHTDYISMFHGFAAALKAIPDGATASDKHAQAALDFLRERRIALSPVRQKLMTFRSLVDGDDAVDLPKVEKDFLWSLVVYFQSTVAEEEVPSTLATDLLDKLEIALTPPRLLAAPSGPPKEYREFSLSEVRDSCDGVIRRLERSWSKATTDFNKLRFEVTRQTS